MDLNNISAQDSDFIKQAGFEESSPADYQPSLWDGAGGALISGIESGASIASQSGIKGVLATNMQQFNLLYPEESESIKTPVTQAIDNSFSDFRKSIAPNPESTGKAGQVLFGLGEYTPAIAGAVVNPFLAVGMAQQISETATTEELTRRGVSQEDAENIALPRSFIDAAGFLFPAAIGGGLFTRLASGAGINIGIGMSSREATSLMLKDKNYAALANQYRAWDGEALIVDGILGSAFGGAYHFAARSRGESTSPLREGDADPATTNHEADSIVDVQPETPVNDQAANESSITEYESWLQGMRNDASQLMSRGERKVWQSDIANGERAVSRLEAEDAAIRDAAPTGSGGANRRYFESNRDRLEKIASDLNYARDRLQNARETLSPHLPGGQYFDAKANLSRIDQGITPEGAPDLKIRQSDIDAALVINEAHNHDIGASPIIHGTAESMDAHYRAMSDAAESLARGGPVDVSAHVDGFNGVIRPEAIREQAHSDMESALHENNISTSEPAVPRVDVVNIVEGERQFAHFLSDEGSIDPDTGVNIGNSYELATASRLAEEMPDLTIEHPDTGQQVKLSELLDEYNEQIATSQDAANVYPFVASCMLRNPE